MIDSDLIRARELKPPQDCDFWVFAYGSLMWRPGFDFIEKRAALLKGYHRAFCIASTHYRGSVEHPGLVLGLDRGRVAHREDPLLGEPPGRQPARDASRRRPGPGR